MHSLDKNTISYSDMAISGEIFASKEVFANQIHSFTSETKLGMSILMHICRKVFTMNHKYK